MKLAAVLLLLCGCGVANAAPLASYRGVNLILTPHGALVPVDYPALRGMGANWVALVVPCQQQGTGVDCSLAPSDDVIRSEMSKARQASLKVMLKPQVHSEGGGWSGEIAFTSQDDWCAWFQDYQAFVLRFAALKPDALVVGTELGKTISHIAAWRTLIQAVRTNYSGKLTYAANFDEASHVKWWDALDVIGVDAYFPLEAASDAGIDALVQAWQPHRAALQALAERTHKPVIFTEIGYQSRKDAYQTPWQKDPALPDANAQAYAYEAVFEVFGGAPWWSGALWWDWGTDDWRMGFTPNDKPALGVLMAHWRR